MDSLHFQAVLDQQSSVEDIGSPSVTKQIAHCTKHLDQWLSLLFLLPYILALDLGKDQQIFCSHILLLSLALQSMRWASQFLTSLFYLYIYI